MDTECYVNYWSIAFECVDSGRRRLFEMYDGCELDRAGIAKILRNWRVVTFNGRNYDVPMLCLAMREDTTNGQLKKASDSIILSDLRSYQFEELYGVSAPQWLDHIDLMEVNPGAAAKPSLKLMMGRLHSRKMQDLPFAPDVRIDETKRTMLRTYVFNDTSGTIDLYREMKPQLDLRAQMSVEYGVDLRSKSDAQIAEAVIKAEVERITGKRIYKPDVRPGVFNYIPPRWVRFETQDMRELLHTVKNTKFVIQQNGQVRMPAELEGRNIEIGNSIYRMGIGGLHSQESCMSHFANDEFRLEDNDVTGYYPSLIINNNYAPPHIGEAFMTVYKSIRERRNKAKRMGNKTVAEALKIVGNGSFGKLGSPFSVLYSPNLMIQTTVTGQLAILMLIERVELAGFSVVSANTDGFVTLIDRERYDVFRAVVIEWEWETSLGTENKGYRSLHSRDVNSYLAVDDDGKVKRKGAFAESGPGMPAAMGMKKNPDADIAVEAVIAYITDSVPVEETIQACTDIRKFVVVRRVNGGAEKDGQFIGKALRWYYSTEESGHLVICNSGNAVPMSQGARPLMDLTDDFPDDIDYDWYVREAYAVMYDIGLKVIDPDLIGRTGTTLARMPDQKTIHTVSLPDGVALCGKRQKDMRQKWVEYKAVPEGLRHCTKCKKASEL